MGRQPCCEKVGLKKGPWAAEEDKKLINFILTNGQCCWRAVPKLAGLLRCGKSCRLRWTNYLRPDLKRGLLSDSEEKLVIDLHSKIGNRWSKIAAQLPGRTDNEIKNHWNTHIKKKLKKMGIDPNTHKSIVVNNSSVNSEEEEKEEQQTEKLQMEVTEEGEDHSNSGNKNLDIDHILSKSSGFCIEDVPMVQPDEIIVPATTTSSSSSSTTTTTRTIASASSSSSNISSSDSPEEFQFLNIDWLQQESMKLWGMDDDLDGEALDFNWENNTINVSTAEKLCVDPFGQFNNWTGVDKDFWRFPLL